MAADEVTFLMLSLLVIWAALLLALVVFAIGRPGKGGALSLAYFLDLSLLHVPGVLPFLGPGLGLPDSEETQTGFLITIFGMAAFVIGAFAASRINRQRAVAESAPPHRRMQALQHLGQRALVLGIAAYFVVLPLSGVVPSLTSIVAALTTLLVLGLWLILYGAVMAGDRGRALATLALLPLLPLGTVVAGGFIGYGVSWVLSSVAFLFVISRRRFWFYVAALPAMFLGLSIFVTYMGQREGIREAVWYQHAGLIDRFDRIASIFTEFQLFDPASPEQAEAMERLNQNWLVGAAIAQHESGYSDFAYGATVPMWSLIPRAAWPDKPDVGGSGDLVSEFTGIRFAEDTSVGVGQVLEFYINFGITGVLIGFLGIGWLLMRLDHSIMRALATDDMRKLLVSAMLGLMLLQPGGSMLEILVGCIAAYLAALLLNWLNPFAIRSEAQPWQNTGLRAS